MTTVTNGLRLKGRVDQRSTGLLLNALRRHHQLGLETEIIIASGGGDAEAAFDFIDAVRAENLTYQSHGLREVCSAAMAIFLNGTIRTAINPTLFKFHQMKIQMSERLYTDAELQSQIDKLSHYHQRFIDLMIQTSTTNLSSKKAEEIITEAKPLSIDDMVEFGFMQK